MSNTPLPTHSCKMRHPRRPVSMLAARRSHGYKYVRSLLQRYGGGARTLAELDPTHYAMIIRAVGEPKLLAAA